ncbi:MAG TPA: N-acetylmuramoyl-L-alanine amidase [Gemmatimonadales bacterium]
MTPLLLALMTWIATGPPAAPRAERTLIVATSRGEVPVPIRETRGHAALPTPALERLLPMVGEVDGDWATVSFAGASFRFLLGAPVVAYRGRAHPLAGGAYVARDTLFVPLQLLSEIVPRIFTEGYRYDPLAVRFEEARLTPVISAAPAPAPTVEPEAGPPLRAPSEAARRRGFRAWHKVVIDPGHGGVDRGNPGLFLPRGVQEANITLAVAKLVQRMLNERGVEVVMTRTTDTLIALGDRSRFCRASCDAFVSIHVNSLARRTGYQAVNGVETYFLGASATAEARRVGAMENEALRFETGYEPSTSDDPLSFIFKDLQTNEFLRESAQLADLVQSTSAAVHPGRDRGAMQNPYLVVLRTATRPAILFEAGFATNRGDAAFLASTDGQRKLATAIADGIERYLKQYERKILGDDE